MKQPLELVKLNFTSPLHLSRGKSGLDTSFELIHSDTLKSALYVCAMDLDMDILKDDESDAFFNSFSISSAFPFAKEEFFFPKPEWISTALSNSLKTEFKKDFKKIRYFSQTYFEQLLRGDLKTLDETCFKHIKYYTDSDLPKGMPFKSETVQRVTVSRNYEEDAGTFYTERLYFHQDCGLFFLIHIKDEAYRSAILAALRLLGDNGIGSDKTVGNGQFEASDFQPFSFRATEKADKQISLSLFCPKDIDVFTEGFLKESAYALTKRGGYLANPDDFNHSTLRKKSVFMFTEGSVFPNNQELKGTVVDLKPDKDVNHAVWRDGNDFFLPYNLPIENESKS